MDGFGGVPEDVAGRPADAGCVAFGGTRRRRSPFGSDRGDPASCTSSRAESPAARSLPPGRRAWCSTRGRVGSVASVVGDGGGGEDGSVAAAARAAGEPVPPTMLCTSLTSGSRQSSWPARGDCSGAARASSWVILQPGSCCHMRPVLRSVTAPALLSAWGGSFLASLPFWRKKASLPRGMRSARCRRSRSLCGAGRGRGEPCVVEGRRDRGSPGGIRHPGGDPGRGFWWGPGGAAAAVDGPASRSEA